MQTTTYDNPPTTGAKDSGSTVFRRVAIVLAAIGALTAIGLTLGYMSRSLCPLCEVDATGVLFLAIVLIATAMPFLIAGGVSFCRRETSIHIASIVFMLLALASCWGYVELAFRLVKPDALESLLFVFLPFCQLFVLAVLIGAANIWTTVFSKSQRSDSN